ncbi:MAG: AAA family ATPase [Proteobacteria bacterium]|nr:AAA family ATPase [Pseudomonadota bacterium]
MYLRKIIACGFKSFADKVTLRFDKDHITGVIGPNGSGKSNIIDSVRWVMGEQSAKTLRGEKSTDLIFSGSSQRRSLGMAEVSLVFDNSEFSPFCPQEYRHENEIILTRRVYRDGSREVSINGRVCRLKDLMDFFQTAGMGSRGYAIIQQGQIGDILKAKPQELRETIEEIAGVLTFKVKIAESQKKLDKTQDNLARVDDLILEVVRQKNLLAQQAEACKVHERISSSIDILERQLLAHRLREAVAGKESSTAEQESLDIQLKELSDKSAALSQQRSTLKLEHNDLSAQLLELREGITLLRESLAAKEVSLKNLHTLAEKSNYRISEYTASLKLDREALNNYKEKLAAESLDYAHMCKQRDEEKRRSLQCAQRYRESAEQWKSFQSTFQKLKEQKEAVAKKLFAAELSLKALGERKQHIVLELSSAKEAREASEALVRKQHIDQQAYSLRVERLSGLRKEAAVKLKELKGQSQKLAASLEDLRDETVTLQCQKASLESKKQLYASWLKEDAADHLPLKEAFKQHQEGNKEAAMGVFLADYVFLKPAFKELSEALSYSLSRWLEHVSYPVRERFIEGSDRDLVSFCAVIEKLQQASQKQPWSGGDIYASFGLPNVAEQHTISEPCMEVGAEDVESVEDVENNHFVSFYPQYVGLKDETLAESLKKIYFFSGNLADLRCEMLLDKVVILPSGLVLAGSTHRVSAVWYKRSSRSYLSSKRDLEDTEDALLKVMEVLRIHAEREAVLQKDFQVCREEIQQAEAACDKVDKAYQSELVTFHSFERELELSHQASKEHASLASKHSRTLEDMKVQESTALENIQKWQQDLAVMEEDLKSCDNEGESLQNRLREDRDQDQAAQLAYAASGSKVDVLKKNIAQFEEYILTLEKGLQEKQDALARDRQDKESNVEVRAQLQSDMAGLLSDRAEEEKKLHQVESVLSQVGQRLSAVETTLSDLEKRCIGLRASYQKAQLTAQRCQEQLAEYEATCESQYNISTLVLLSEVAEISEDSAKLEAKWKSLKAELSALGAMNFIAASEHDALLEREMFLEKQKTDLEKSLAVIKETIAEAQKMSDDKFSQVFSILSEEFSRLFPILFPQGSADLVLDDGVAVKGESIRSGAQQHPSSEVTDLAEDEEMMSAESSAKDDQPPGVKIMVQLPGKKRQPLALFSGGEKALTAIALVMAFLKTKPTPFCLLDEVDAPLDEANVGRYNDLLAALNQKFQFIVVTHNRKTMEVFDRLYGVTMQEPGVSKLVSVDLESALPAHLQKSTYVSSPSLLSP